ncbi:MAG: DUF1232 domain-containing protein [Anaerolineales bacterium]|jgi:uncharacterized membrane protein YkvA (DUF1232 family)|uniref:YkvA family protein n=1 Tax=Candidatus Villigracilis affinis TaxID=3140682 RepID=UPI001D427BDB|nr:DUF1232 domain-containing protein [Anaerolineales bacterium]MBK9600268.1 DUF1232 domain-containing protein [Anaerolineales bacterium]MBL0344246.1 DUF1232 domain-containing protein [Anaerolineales bacterium]
MTEKKPSEIMVSQQGGVVRNVINQLKLIFRLMGDKRVSVLAKAIPLGAFAYLLFPADLAPNIALPVIGVLDDAAILWLGSYVFTELCPPEVVAEHMKALSANINPDAAQDDVVDAETTEVNDKQP